MGEVLLYVRPEFMDDVRGRVDGASTEGRGSGEDGRAWSLATYGGADGGSGRRLGVRIRTLREGLGAAVCLDVLPDGVGECARSKEVRVEESMGGGDGVVSLGGGGIDGSVDDWPASGSFSKGGRSPLSLFRSDPTTTTAAPAGADSRMSKCVADEAKFGDSCRISSIDPMSPPLLGACAPSFCPFSPSVCAGAKGAALSLLLSLDVRCSWGAGELVRNVTLRLSRLNADMGRYCD